MTKINGCGLLAMILLSLMTTGCIDIPVVLAGGGQLALGSTLSPIFFAPGPGSSLQERLVTRFDRFPALPRSPEAPEAPGAPGAPGTGTGNLVPRLVHAARWIDRTPAVGAPGSVPVRFMIRLSLQNRGRTPLRPQFVAKFLSAGAPRPLDFFMWTGPRGDTPWGGTVAPGETLQVELKGDLGGEGSSGRGGRFGVDIQVEGQPGRSLESGETEVTVAR